MSNDTLLWIFMGIPAFILAGTIHEYMHAWTAQKLGDYTATGEGRLTLNPLAHLDPWGVLMMVFARFGWMKPVPVNEYNFQNRERDGALVALAGPLSNIAQAIIGVIILALLSAISGLFANDQVPILYSFIYSFIFIYMSVNISLAIFNILPIPPLDGYRIMRLFMPRNLKSTWESLENYSFIILLLLFLPFSPLSGLVGWIIGAGSSSVMDFLLGIFRI